MIDIAPCKYCHCKKAEPFRVDDLWYVRCKGMRKFVKKHKDGTTEVVEKRCTAWNTYEFLGMTRDSAIENWNNRNNGE